MVAQVVVYATKCLEVGGLDQLDQACGPVRKACVSGEEWIAKALRQDDDSESYVLAQPMGEASA
jgi:hypothetical protein